MNNDIFSHSCFQDLQIAMLSQAFGQEASALGQQKPLATKAETEKKQIHAASQTRDFWKENFDGFSKITTFSREAFQKLDKFITQNQSSWGEEVRKTGKAKYIRSSKDIPRSLLYTADGKIFVLFNKQKQGDECLCLPKDKGSVGPLVKSASKTIKTAWQWGTNKWFASASLDEPTLIEKAKKGDQLVKRIEGFFQTECLVEYEGKDKQKKLRIIMPLAHQSLFDRLYKNPPLTEAEKDRIAFQLLTALIDLHGRGIVHLDLKTNNVLLVGDKALISDPDTACELNALQPSDEPEGTTRYLPPEYFDEMRKPRAQRNYASVTTKAVDVWEMGILLCRLYGKDPAWCQDTTEKVVTVMDRYRKECAKGKFWMPRKPEGTKYDLIWKMLQFNPAARIATNDIRKYLPSFFNKQS